MRIKLLLAVIATLLCLTTLRAQNFLISGANYSLVSCGSSKDFSLTIPAQTVVPVTYDFAIKSTSLFEGLYFEEMLSSSLPSSVMVSFIDHKNISITVNVANTVSALNFKLYAGYCSIDVPDFITDPFTVGNDQPAFIASIQKNIAGTLLYTAENFVNIPNSGEARNNVILTIDNEGVFRYQMKNNVPDKSFVGYVNLKEDQLPSNFHIDQVVANIFNSNGTKISGPYVLASNVHNVIKSSEGLWIADPLNPLLPLHIGPNEVLIVEEHFTVNGCIQDNDRTYPKLSWGCQKYDISCGKPSNATGGGFDATVLSNPEKPSLTVLSSNVSDIECIGYGGSDAREKSVRLKNNSNVAVKNIRFSLYNNSGQINIPLNNDIRIRITRNSNTETYPLNINAYNITHTSTYTPTTLPYGVSANTLFTPLEISTGASISGYTLAYRMNEGLYGVNNPDVRFQGNFIMSPKDYQNNISPNFAKGVGYGQCGLDNNSSLVVFSLVVDKYNDNGIWKSIELAPSDEIEFLWKEVGCCISDELLGATGYLSPEVRVSYPKDLCTIERSIVSNSLAFIQLNAKAYDYNTTTEGDVDFCASTSDGKVERITSKIGFSNAYPGKLRMPGYLNQNAKFVVRVYLQAGLDLDQSLDGPKNMAWIANKAVDNIEYIDGSPQNNTTGCSNICVGCISTTQLQNPEYGVFLRNGNNIIRATTIQLINTPDNQRPGINTANSFSAKTGTVNANFVYEISFEMDDVLAALLPTLPTSDYNSIGLLALEDAFLDVDLRAHCKGLERPNYKIIMYLDQCSQNTCTYASRFTSMKPLASVAGAMLINCPGCLVPGANVLPISMYRENRGFVDSNDDGNPDQPLALISETHRTAKTATAGDIMVSKFIVAMSDGEANSPCNPISVTKAELDNKNYFLNNLYIRVELPKNITIESIIAGIDQTPTSFQSIAAPLSRINNDYYFIHVPSSLFGLSSFGVSNSVSLIIRYKIGDVMREIDLLEINYQAGYSRCDNCTNVEEMVVINGKLDEINVAQCNAANGCLLSPISLAECSSNAASGLFLKLNDLVQIDKTFITCTSASSTFRFVPYYQDSNVIIDDILNGSCSKRISAFVQGNFYNSYKFEYHNSGALSRQFEGEYRTFIQGTDIIFEIPLPKDYNVDALTITNTGGDTRARSFIQNYTVANPAGLPGSSFIIVNDPTNTNYPTRARITFHAESFSTNMGLIPDYQSSSTVIRNYNGWPGTSTEVHPLLLSDEVYVIRVSLELVANKSCSLVQDFETEKDYYTTDLSLKFLPTCNIMGDERVPFKEENYNPNIFSSPNWLTNNLPTDFTRMIGSPALTNAPAELKGTILGVGVLPVVTNGRVQVPINLENYNALKGLIYPIASAFLYIDGAAFTQGLILEGIYIGNNNIPNPTSANYLTNSSITPVLDVDGKVVSYIVGVPGANVSSRNNNFTLVFRYDCSGCSSLEKSSCGGGGDAQCLKPLVINGNPEANIRIRYGYDCSNNFPTTTSQFANTCKYYEDEPILCFVTNASVAMQLNTVINNSNPIAPCSSFDYDLSITSCEDGELNAFNIALTLPQGFSIDPSVAPYIFENGGMASISLVPQLDNIFNIVNSSLPLNGISKGGTVKVRFKIIPTCMLIADASIKVIVTGTTYCGSFTSKNGERIDILNGSIQLNSLLDNITIPNTGIVLTPNNLSIDYSFSAFQNFDNALFVEVKDVNNQVKYSTTFSIDKVTTVGTITATLNLPSTCANYTVTVTPKLGYVASCGYDINGDVIESCKNVINGTTVSKPITIIGHIPIDIDLTGNTASILCSSAASLTLTATPKAGTPIFDYSWSGPSIVGEAMIASVSINGVGFYTVTITDDNLCTGSKTIEVKNEFKTICPGDICPGENPTLDVNVGGVIGTYTVQWYNQADPNSMIPASITQPGDYFALVITPVCTLQTSVCHIGFKRYPVAFTVSPAGPTAICPGQTVELSVLNPGANDPLITDVIWSTGETSLNPVTVPNTTGPGLPPNMIRPEEAEKGGYFIVAIDKGTGCRTVSNRAVVYGPHTTISRSCYQDAGGTKVLLSAGSNIAAGSYKWYSAVTSPSYQETEITDQALLPAFSNGNNNLIVSTPGIYVVKNDLSQQCGTHWSVYENMLTTGSPNLNIISANDGSFANSGNPVLCSDPKGYTTDFTDCLDRTDYPITDQTFTIGKTMTNYGSYTANDWNPTSGMWSSVNSPGSSATNYMIIDGVTQAVSKRIWYKENIPVQHNLYYLFKASLLNIDARSFTAAKVIPEVKLRIMYKETINGSKVGWEEPIQILYQNTNPQWLDISQFTLAGYGALFDNLPMEAKYVDLEIIMSGGGSVGRDLALDDVELIPVGVCDDITTVLATSSTRACGANFVTIDNSSKYTCKGVPIKLQAFQLGSNSALEFIWKDGNTAQIVNDGDGDPMTLTVSPDITTTYYFTVNDNVNQCTNTRAITVFVVTPVVHIVSNPPSANICTNANVSFLVDRFAGVGNVSYQWYKNGTAISGETGYNYTPLSTLLIDNDQIECKMSTVCTINGNANAQVISNIINVKGQMYSASPAGVDKTTCKGTAITLGSPAITGVTYSWSPATYLDNATKAEPVVTPTGNETSLTYSLTVIDVNGCTKTDDVIITVTSLPSLPNITSPVTYCKGTTALPLTATGTNLLWYTVSTGGVSISTPTPSTSTVGTISYFVSQTVNACEGARAQIDVVVNALPTLVITNPSVVCSPGTVNLTSSSVTASSTSGLTYTYWTDAGATTSYGLPTTAGAGTYYIKGTDAASCFAISPVIATINPIPIVSITNPSAVCSPSTVDITTSSITSGSTSGLIYTYWTDAVAATVYGTPTTAGAGTYYIKGTTAANCSAISAVTVTVNPIPIDFNFNAGPTTLCQGTALNMNITTPESQTGVTYSMVDYPLSSKYLGGGTSPSGFAWALEIKESTGFTVRGRAINTTTGCQRIKSQAIIVNPKPTMTPVISANSYNCSTNQYTLSVTAASGYTASWYNNSLFLYESNTALATGTSYSPTIDDRTWYNVRWQNTVTGCFGDYKTAYLHNKCKGLKFDGTEDLVKISNPVTGLMSDASSAFTYELFFNPASGGLSRQALISNREVVDGITIGLDAGKPYVKVNNVAIYKEGTGFSAITYGVCHHLVVTRESSSVSSPLVPNQLKIYLDGVLRYTGTLTTSPVVNLPIRFGKDFAVTDGSLYKGMIDEVRIWNKVLSTTEMSSYANQNVMANVNLRAVWMLMEGTGQIVSEAKNSVNNGVLGGTTAVEAHDPTWDPYICSAPSYLRGSLGEEPVSNSLNFEVKTNPNPFTTETNVTVMGAKSASVQLLILDVNGKTLYENNHFPVNEEISIGEDLPSGMHILRVIDGEKIKTIKMLKFK